MKTVSIVDYGLGNLYSVMRAVEYLDFNPVLVNTAEQILEAERLILPGVGAFKNGMEGLRGLNLIEPIQKFCLSGKYFLGICLGMQLMFESGEEFGFHEGLGLLRGKVCALPNSDVNGCSLRVPHVGWNLLQKAATDSPLLSQVSSKKMVYFVHSFSAIPTTMENVIATTEYGGHSLVAAVKSGNLYGCQFHPERSGPVGLKILQNFLNL